MLWFKFFLFPFVSDNDNKFATMKNQKQTGLKYFKPRKNLNHNIYISKKKINQAIQKISISCFCVLKYSIAMDFLVLILIINK